MHFALLGNLHLRHLDNIRDLHTGLLDHYPKLIEFVHLLHLQKFIELVSLLFDPGRKCIDELFLLGDLLLY